MSANEALIQIYVDNDIEGLIDIVEQNNYNINYQTNDYFQNKTKSFYKSFPSMNNGFA